MKKYILILILSLVSLTSFAKAPNLNVEKVFDGTYNSTPGVTVNISKAPEKYFRCINVTNNAKIVKKIAGLFEKDMPKGLRSQDVITNGMRYRSFVVVNNKEEINVGLSEQNHGCYLFITGPLNAFK